MSGFLNDLRYCLRTLRKNPGFAAMAVLTLALGIGANTAIFSVVSGILLKPLPFEDPDRVVSLYNQFLALNLKYASTSVADFYDYRQLKHIFEEVATINGMNFNLTGAEKVERIPGAAVSASLFPMLGTKPLVGRLFTEDDDQPGRDKIVILDEGLWRNRFGADRNILGQKVQLSGEPYTVIGVVPSVLGAFAEMRMFKPAGFTPEQKSPNRRGNQFLFTIGRLKKGVSLQQARAGMDTFGKQLQKQFPDNYPPSAGWSIQVEPLSERVTGDLRPALLILLGAVGFVLLIACANVANLLLARSTARSREIAIRSTLGAGSRRIARQLMTESLLLGLIGGGAGLLLGEWIVVFLVQNAPPGIPRMNEIRLDSPVLLFTFAISLASGLLFGMFPVMKLASANLNDTLKEAGRGNSGNLRRHKLRSLLVIAEVALSLVLLVGAGLMLQSFFRLQRVDPGFRAHNVLTFQISLPKSHYATDEQASLFFDRLLKRVQSLPGVSAAGATSTLPFSGNNSSGSFNIEGLTVPPGGTGPHADQRSVSPRFFAAMGIPLRQGRAFEETDSRPAPPVAVIDEKLARQYWPNQDPIGKRVNRGDKIWITIVGIVGHIQHSQLDSESKGVLYTCYLQGYAQAMGVVVRTDNDPKLLTSAVPRVVSELDKDMPVFGVQTMEQRLSASLVPRRAAMTLLLIFAGLALLLASVGIYGVISQTVTQRTQEIGIRIALGAERKVVLGMILKQAMTLTGIGLGAGIAGGLVVTQFMKGILFGVNTTDPLTFLVVAFFLGAVAALASYLPAWRATRIDPTIALRYE
jgi:putative ABC transport system permease protein